MKDIDFKKYFKFPLKYVNPVMVNTSDNKRAIDFLTSWRNDDKVKNYIVKTLNGEISQVPDDLGFSDNYRYENCEVFLDDKKIMRIRGWGYLTGMGSGGLKLLSEEAIKIQDEFGEFIVKCLKLN